ncbi:hypothetical protein ACFWXH_30220 [Mesorhizobium sp. NPDC059054]|uniref:hypothetical protein n=1 Tax=Mesorhizobium sp. NPDC059054 TaxID=3346711 RepID=UPI0036A85A28
MSKVQAYQEAFRIHAAAQKAASDAVQEIYNISNAISNSLRSFMGWQFNMDINRRQGRFDPKSQVDLDKWPSADQLKTS